MKSTLLAFLFCVGLGFANSAHADGAARTDPEQSFLNARLTMLAAYQQADQAESLEFRSQYRWIAPLTEVRNLMLSIDLAYATGGGIKFVLGKVITTDASLALLASRFPRLMKLGINVLSGLLINLGQHFTEKQDQDLLEESTKLTTGFADKEMELAYPTSAENLRLNNEQKLFGNYLETRSALDTLFQARLDSLQDSLNPLTHGNSEALYLKLQLARTAALLKLDEAEYLALELSLQSTAHHS